MKSLIALALFLMSLSTLADMIAPSHTCQKPDKPYRFTSQAEIDNFNNDVARYKQCIKRFVDEQNRETENHQRAASSAVEEWNRYVQYELR